MNGHGEPRRMAGHFWLTHRKFSAWATSETRRKPHLRRRATIVTAFVAGVTSASEQDSHQGEQPIKHLVRPSNVQSPSSALLPPFEGESPSRCRCETVTR